MPDEWKQSFVGKPEETFLPLRGVPQEDAVQHQVRYPGAVHPAEAILRGAEGRQSEKDLGIFECCYQEN